MENEKYKRKYTMYILDYTEWITDFNLSYQMEDSKCFQTGQWDATKNEPVKPYKLNVEEAIWCIVDCGSLYNSYRFKIFPEKEFLKEYEEYKKDPVNKNQFDWWIKYSSGVNFDDILNIPKRIIEEEYLSINRNTFVDCDGEVGKRGFYTYYTLTANNNILSVPNKMSGVIEGKRIDGSYDFERRLKCFFYSTPIISLKVENGTYEIETLRAIYKTKKIVSLDFVDPIGELDKYLKSDYFKEFFEKWHKEEMLYADREM